MAKDVPKRRIGDVRRGQVLHTFGVGSVIDLPSMSAIVLGLHRWEVADPNTIVTEERLLKLAQTQLGSQVERLRLAPVPPADANPLEPESVVGLPVAPFPRWLRCPRCELLAEIDSGHFQIKHNPYYPDRTRYVHVSCPKGQKPPTVTPARFVFACEAGHLDDFPWKEFIGCPNPDRCGPLRFQEAGVSSEVADLWVKCDREGCVKPKVMAHAFGDKADEHLPACTGRHPHLGKTVEESCKADRKAMLVGASNLWFPITISALSLPNDTGSLANLVERHWAVLEHARTKDILEAFRSAGHLDVFAAWSSDDLWAAIEEKRKGTGEDEGSDDLKVAEWAVFSNPASAPKTDDFRLTEAGVPQRYAGFIERVVLVERLRAVRAMLGFTRIGSPGDYAKVTEIPENQRAPLSRALPTWLPASEVRGEGVFLQLRESAVAEFTRNVELRRRDEAFRKAHTAFRRARRIASPEAGYPGLRYVLLHTLSHALIRQFAIECGYSAASIEERIYAREPEADDGPMAGVLLMTAAADSEGTLGGLVALGKPDALGRHLDAALEHAKLCSSDPLCSEQEPGMNVSTLHGAGCHACAFVSETSCERGNKYLDRSLLVPTMAGAPAAFFTDLVEA